MITVGGQHSVGLVHTDLVLEVCFLEVGSFFGVISGGFQGDQPAADMWGDVQPDNRVGPGQPENLVFDLFYPLDQCALPCGGHSRSLMSEV